MFDEDTGQPLLQIEINLLDDADFEAGMKVLKQRLGIKDDTDVGTDNHPPVI